MDGISIVECATAYEGLKIGHIFNSRDGCDVLGADIDVFDSQCLHLTDLTVSVCVEVGDQVGFEVRILKCDLRFCFCSGPVTASYKGGDGDSLEESE